MKTSEMRAPRVTGFKTATPFIVMHLAALSVFTVEFQWKYLLIAIASYYFRMFGVVAGYHRYFSHRSFELGRVRQFCLAFLAETTAQKGVLWWAAHHRYHHQHSDQPSDLHSPLQQGFLYSHVGWIFNPNNEATQWERIKDFARFPELRWLNRHYWIPPTVYGLALLALGGWGAAAWGFFMSTVWTWHGTFTINSLSHVFGSQRYATKDTSRNNWLLSLITLGEGWHNNHHCYPAAANQGFFWWEVDGAFYVLKTLSWFGIVKKLKKPPLERLTAQLKVR